MSADSRTTISSEPTQTLREVHTHRPSTEFVCCSPCSQCTLCWTGWVTPHSSSAHYLHHAQFEKPKMFQCQIRVCWSRQKKLLPHLRGVNTTRLIWSFTPDVTSNWFLSHFNITHQNTESSPVRPQKKHIHGFNIKNQQIFSSLWINCKLCVSELLSSCWAKVKKSRSAVTGSDWLSGRGPPCLLTAALEHAGVQSTWPTRPLSPLTSIKNMPKTFCCFCTGISNVLFSSPARFYIFRFFYSCFSNSDKPVNPTDEHCLKYKLFEIQGLRLCCVIL